VLLKDGKYKSSGSLPGHTLSYSFLAPESVALGTAAVAEEFGTPEVLSFDGDNHGQACLNLGTQLRVTNSAKETVALHAGI
jgi:hypothetical protein